MMVDLEQPSLLAGQEKGFDDGSSASNLMDALAVASECLLTYDFDNLNKVPKKSIFNGVGSDCC